MTLASRLASAARSAWSAFASYTPIEEAPAQRPVVGLFDSGRSRFESSWSGSLTPARLGAALRDAEDGDISSQAEIFELIEQDGRIMATLRKRRRAVLKRKLTLLAAPRVSGSADEARAKKAVEVCCEALDRCENLPDGLFDATDAIGRGFSCTDIGWHFDGALLFPRLLRWWPQRCFTIDRDDRDELRVLTAEQPVYGEPLVPQRWMVHRCRAQSSSLAKASLGRTLAWMYAFKHWGIAEWLILAEQWSRPTALGKYRPSNDDVERAAVKRAVRDIARAGAAVIPDGASIDLLEATAAGDAPHEKLITLCNEEISIAVLGVTLTTAQGDKGARSLGVVHASDQDELIDSDAEALARTIRRDLLTPIVRWNLGADFPVPLCELPSEQQSDRLKEAQADRIILHDIALPVAVDDLYERYGFRKPADGEVLLVRRGDPPTEDTAEESPDMPPDDDKQKDDEEGA